MKTLTVEQLQYELDLCCDVLFGVWLPEYKTGLKGMMNETAADYRVSGEHFEEAKRCWLTRYKRAQEELMERHLLGHE
jgi:hypothetical protein